VTDCTLRQPAVCAAARSGRYRGVPRLEPAAMNDALTTVRNHHEAAVFEAVAALAPRFPVLADDPELLADVACVALNRLPPRYIRHVVDLRFYQSEQQRADHAQAVDAAVMHAFEFVQARALMGART
jgi:hypothetical protein